MLFVSMGLLTFSGVLVAILRSWRALGPALALYVAAGAAAHWSALGPVAGLASLLGGWVAVVLLLRALGGEVEAASGAGEPPVGEGPGQPVLLVGVAIALAGAYALALAWPLGGPSVLGFACYWLFGIGLLVLLTAGTAPRRGLGLLLLLGAGQVLGSALSQAPDPAFALAGALAEVLLALAIGRVAGRAAGEGAAP